MAGFSPTIPVYRQGETQPTYFSLAQIHDMVRGIEAGKQANAPAFASENYLPRMLKEVRSDAGTNEFDSNNPASYRMYQTIMNELRSEGIPDATAAAWYPVAVSDKLREAKRLGTSYDKLYIGTGKAATGMTGSKYAAMGDTQSPALQDPRNAGLLDYVARSRTGELTPQERLNTHAMDWKLNDLFGNARAEKAYLQRYADTLPSKDKQDLLLSIDSLTHPSNLLAAYRKRSGFVEPTYSKNNAKYEQRGEDFRNLNRQYVDKMEEQTPVVKRYLDTRLGVTPQDVRSSWIDKIREMFSK